MSTISDCLDKLLHELVNTKELYELQATQVESTPYKCESVTDTLTKFEELTLLKGKAKDESQDCAICAELSKKVSDLAHEIRGGFINLKQPRRSLADKLESLVIPVKDVDQ